ncbi:hypothetical protein DH2020_045977 [Rehmannia glutinosa]|uniref:F-box domain-containing protein n=1 Tax=Rehmannia glutinosa TaxID=99300 RepID=A0ABR0UD93_REHGL
MTRRRSSSSRSSSSQSSSSAASAIRSPTLRRLRQFRDSLAAEEEISRVVERSRSTPRHLQASLQMTDIMARVEAIADELKFQDYISIEDSEDLEAIAVLRRRFAYLGGVRIKRHLTNRRDLQAEAQRLQFVVRVCAKRCQGDDDRISKLPDDILVVILSFLSLKETARTSVLSSRWINLWKHTSSLNFDADSTLNKIAQSEEPKERRELLEEERGKYTEWVNHVLQSHEAPTLREFRICFDLDVSSQNAITKWLEFAFARKVQRLELDLLDDGENIGDPSINYVFPEELLFRSSGTTSTLQPPSDNSCIHQPRTLIDLKSLTALSLKCVNVTGEAIEFFLRNCPLLEKLVVHGTDRISDLEVCGSSLVLKHLEICCLFGLKSIKVSAPNLTSLNIDRLDGLVLENVPMLVEVYVICGRDSIEYLLPALTCCISQLEILNLELLPQKEIIERCRFSELPKLKKLLIEYWTKGDESLIGLTSLITASPYLEEFVLKLIWRQFSRSDREVKSSIGFPHLHLKVFKFCGYYGRTSDVELVRYIVENCIVLEKMIIDPRCQLLGREPRSHDKLDEEQTARKYAKQQLEGELPQHIELVIL